MKPRTAYFLAAIVGVVCGLISDYSFMAGSWLNLVFWALAGVLLGYLLGNEANLRGSGISFGLFLTLSFLLAGFQGASDQVPGFLLLTALLSLVGIVAGVASLWIGHWLGQKFIPY